MVPAVGSTRLPVRTVELDERDAPDVRDLVDHLPQPAGVLAWLRGGEGMVGWGEAARLEVSGADRFRRAARWWEQLCAAWAPLGHPAGSGRGPVAFGSFSFDDGPTTSVLVVPRVLVGRSDGRAWLTTVGPEAPPGLGRPTSQPPAPRGLRYAGGAVPVTAFRESVAAAVARIRSGELAKVVLAQDLMASAEDDIDERFVLRGLASAYPDCWTFGVDGLVGATPELLVRRTGDLVLSRVLAGTSPRGGDPADDGARRDALSRSPKDLEEHRYAVESVAQRLGPHCADLVVPPRPSVLGLHNVWHLVSDVTGRQRDELSALELAGALHPTAAVGGTPPDVAARVREELEQMDRGRYAGPVGWVDARGDGEWGLALRCALVEGPSARLFAGCGIVADSDPDEEVREAATKFVPVRDALAAPARADAGRP